MKKALAMMGALLCILLMSGCVEGCATALWMFGGSAIAKADAGAYPFIHKTEDFDDVKIELVTLENVPDEEIGGFTNNVIAVKEISDEEKQTFINEFTALEFIYPFGDPVLRVSGGQAVLFTYPDGQVEVVTDYGCGLFADRTLEENISYNGQTCPEEPFAAFWDKWSQS